MKATEVRKKSESELQKILQESREKLRDLRFRVNANKLKNVQQIKRTKKEIARILTILNQKRNKK